MGIFTPAASDLDLALVVTVFTVVGFILAYIVLPFAAHITGRTQ